MTESSKSDCSGKASRQTSVSRKTSRSGGATPKQGVKKPRPDFPLWAHPSGRWCKKVRSRFFYFGKIEDDPKGVKAIKLWREQQEDIYAYGEVRERQEGVTIGKLCNDYLESKEKLMESGELSPRTFASYRAATDKIIAAFGKHELVTRLTPQDFERLRYQLAKGRGPVSLRNDVRHIRMAFKWGYDVDLLKTSVKFGPGFKIPKKEVLRKQRQKSQRTNGKRMFEAADLRSIIDAAGQPLKAMILLGINCGLGNTDISSLTMHDLDLDAGWLDYPRPKTAVERRCPLWPETITAIREWLAIRPKSSSEPDLVFVTKYGQRFVRVSESGGPIDGVAGEFGKLLRRPRCPQCGCINRAGRGEKPERCQRCEWKPDGDSDWTSIHRPRLNFYALRHTTQTIGEDAKDLPALRLIMGHTDQSISNEYREGICDDRLQAVTDCTHSWLWPTD